MREEVREGGREGGIGREGGKRNRVMIHSTQITKLVTQCTVLYTSL